MNDGPTVRVQLVTDQPRESIRHVELHFDQPLLEQGELRVITPGNHALDHLHECTPLMQNILRQLFGAEDLGVTQVIITVHHLTIDHFAALTNSHIFAIIEHAASDAHLTCHLSNEK